MCRRLQFQEPLACRSAGMCCRLHSEGRKQHEHPEHHQVIFTSPTPVNSVPSTSRPQVIILMKSDWKHIITTSPQTGWLTFVFCFCTNREKLDVHISSSGSPETNISSDAAASVSPAECVRCLVSARFIYLFILAGCRRTSGGCQRRRCSARSRCSALVSTN